MNDKAWYRENTRKQRLMRDANDREGLRKLIFGRFVRESRRYIEGLTQAKAAYLAGISTSEWLKIEGGKHLPRPDKIADIADAIRVQVNALYRKAGYEVPKKYSRYEEQSAAKDFIYALKESSSFEELISRLAAVWQQYQQDQTNPGKRKSIYIDLKQAALLAHIYEVMNLPQRINLARELLRGVDQKTIRATLRDAPDLLKKFSTRSD